jgi:hypothetical protein
MPRSFTKVQLLEDARRERAALEKLLEKLSPEEMVQSATLGDWSLKDVLAHLIEWELPALNQHIYEKYRDRPLAEILEQFHSSYQQVLASIQGLPEEILFTRGYYSWSGNNALAAYFHSCTAAHYLWARKEVQKKVKVQKVK